MVFNWYGLDTGVVILTSEEKRTLCRYIPEVDISCNLAFEIVKISELSPLLRIDCLYLGLIDDWSLGAGQVKRYVMY